MLKLKQRAFEDVSWACPGDMHPLLHRLLILRGVKSDEEARRFMHPDRDMLRDPFLLSDMHKAVDIINDALSKGERICVYGDYDVDGVCASAILTLYLKELGADCDVYLPSRHTEGYGLNADAVDFISQDHSLLVTVDCGITAFELVDRAKQKGMRVIITDHHRPGDRLPSCPTVNPLLGNYPFGYLCGAGVAFQLVSALAGREKAMDYIDLAALATIADIVPLRDENRAIAQIGLKKINISARPGLRALINVSGLEGRRLNEGNIAFQLTPRMNASGRMGDAKRAYDLMTSTDFDVCMALALELDQENKKRKDYENKAVEEAEEQLKGFDFANNPVIIVKGEDWNPGVIGLVASRLTEKYHCPSIALTRDGEYYTGSCRSIEGVNIHEALKSVSHLLDRFGGHEMAAGLKINESNLDAFVSELNAYFRNNCDISLWIPVKEYDANVDAGELSVQLAREIEALSPTGCGNPEPVLLMRGQISECYTVGREKEHLKLGFTSKTGAILPGIWFRHGSDAQSLNGEADILFTPGVNEYLGQSSLQAMVKQIIPRSGAFNSKGDERRFAAFMPYLSQNFSLGGVSRAVTIGELGREFSANFRGNLLIAADAESAEAALRAIGENADVFIGEYPLDPRSFNALCLCPTGKAPSDYKRIYYAGIPSCLCLGGKRVLGIQVSPLFSHLPEKDALRNIFKAFRQAMQSEAVYESLSDACLNLSAQSNIDCMEFALGACVLVHIGLCAFIETAKGIKVGYSNEKKNPFEDELYIALSRNGG